MLHNYGFRLLLAAESLALGISCICWLRVWVRPSMDRIKTASLMFALLIAFRALFLSAVIVVTTG
jgi:hypothetical protein